MATDNPPVDAGSAYVFRLTTVPAITSAVLAGSNLVFGGIDGSTGGTYYVLATTNAVDWLTNWVCVATNTFETNGTFSVTNALDPAKRQEFFRLQVP